MRLSSILRPLAVSAVITTIGASLSCNTPRAAPAVALARRNDGLVLQDSEGERRVRRTAGKGPFIIKVDRQNGGSPDLVMGYEDIAPGAEIQLHRHLVADEILFVHRGTGTASLNGRKTHVSAGATIYIPRNVTIGLVNDGTEPLGITFTFSKPGVTCASFTDERHTSRSSVTRARRPNHAIHSRRRMPPRGRAPG